MIFVLESAKGYLFGVNDCQTTATKFRNHIKCSDPTHGHAEANIPTSGRRILGNVAHTGTTSVYYAAESMFFMPTLEAHWPAVETVVTSTVHHLANNARQAVDWIGHIPILMVDNVIGHTLFDFGNIPGLLLSFVPGWIGATLGLLRMCYSLYKRTRLLIRGLSFLGIWFTSDERRVANLRAMSQWQRYIAGA